MRFLLGLVMAQALLAPAVAGVESANDISANVAVVTSFDTSTGLYTFTAKLNGADVSAQFLVLEPNRRRAVFQFGPGSPLMSGKNVLTTSVDGTVPGSTHTATDSDRVVFLAQ